MYEFAFPRVDKSGRRRPRRAVHKLQSQHSCVCATQRRHRVHQNKKVAFHGRGNALDCLRLHRGESSSNLHVRRTYSHQPLVCVYSQPHHNEVMKGELLLFAFVNKSRGATPLAPLVCWLAAPSFKTTHIFLRAVLFDQCE